MPRTICIVLIVLLAIPCVSSAGTIDVIIKGIDDGVKTNNQQDYNEAVMNAKLQAIERAGVEIQSITQVANFRTKFDMVEGEAKAVLLPGFQIMDIGYLKNGTYQVVLIGKAKAVSEETPTRFGNKKEDLNRTADFDGRFVAYNNGVVLDTKTYLEWYCESDRGTSWYQAKRWVGSLKVVGGGWGMPSIRELKTLYKTEKYKMTPLQKNTFGERVWSSNIKDFSTALFFDFEMGHEFIYDKSITLIRCRALAVRPRKQ
ncbi:MAG: DUF1566 domain-containing protein [Desulfobacteraceae bacterium]|nr:DUF1566 domain-containing protein [Desulfobacteraceae bacterium]